MRQPLAPNHRRHRGVAQVVPQGLVRALTTCKPPPTQVPRRDGSDTPTAADDRILRLTAVP